MHRFFVAPDNIDGHTVTLDGGVAHQISTVLRARPGEGIVVLDDTGWEYAVTLDRVTPHQVQGTIIKRMTSKGEPSCKITLYQAVLKARRFEYVLQKCTELGVSRFVPVFCERSVPRDRGGSEHSKRHSRWQTIIAEAAEQSRRGKLPALELPFTFSEACDSAEDLALIPWEEEKATGLKTLIQSWGAPGCPDSTVSIFTGPEGGFTQEEVEQARASGFVPVSLGSRTLRAETAPVAVVAAILYELDELGA